MSAAADVLAGRAAWAIEEGDVLDRLAELPDGSVNCVVTSPPYFQLRNYGVEGQIGLEQTLAEYVAKMVEVFRAARRVMRPDACLWLNLGDSYATNPSNGRGGETVEGGTPHRTAGDKRGAGAKPKDLLGVPWAVAEALKAPYYTGRIKDERDRIWLAAMIDAEGCMFIHRRKEGMSNGQGYFRKADGFGAGLEVANVHEAIVRRCLAITGLGSICTQGPNENHRRVQTIHRWNLRSNVCRDVIREVYPYLVAKQHEARILLGCPSSGPKADAAHVALKALHNGVPTDVDFPPPASLFEPGFYLRSDVIFSKANPMPESVTDRPTRSHEYLFLLTKSARYAYDADAIREPLEHPELVGKMRLSGVDGLVGQRGDVGRHHEYANPAGRNRRTVWTIATEAFPESHFATMPTALVEPCILAGCPARTCPACGARWTRVTERVDTGRRQKMADGWDTGPGGHGTIHRDGREAGAPGQPVMATKTLGWAPACAHGLAPIPGVVLDPFCGSGTVVLEALRHGRRGIGFDLSPDYVAVALGRVVGDAPLFNGATAGAAEPPDQAAAQLPLFGAEAAG